MTGPTFDAGSKFDRQIARIAVGAYDDAQSVRTSMMNRVRDVVRKKREGIPFDEVEDEKEDQDYSSEYSDDNLPELVREMNEEDVLTDHEHDYLQRMLTTAQKAAKVENEYKNIMKITEAEPIYSQWLTDVYGVSTTLTAKLIHQFGYCEKFDKPSQLWSYSGWAPGQERKRGEQLNYSPDAKTLTWNVADKMWMQGANSKFRTHFYDPYKEEQIRRMGAAEEMTDEELAEKDWSPPKSRGHAQTRSKRYLAKKFLKHYWFISRDMMGLETPDEWVITHGGHDKMEESFENPAYAYTEVTGRPYPDSWEDYFER